MVKIKFLIIGNREGLRQSISLLLNERYPEAKITFTPLNNAGLRKIYTDKPDLVILDDTVADIDTLETIKSIRKISSVLLIVISQSAFEIDVVSYLEAGADDCIYRPFNKFLFLARADAILRRAYANRLKLMEKLSAVSNPLLVYYGLQVPINNQQLSLVSQKSWGKGLQKENTGDSLIGW